MCMHVCVCVCVCVCVRASLSQGERRRSEAKWPARHPGGRAGRQAGSASNSTPHYRGGQVHLMIKGKAPACVEVRAGIKPCHLGLESNAPDVFCGLCDCISLYLYLISHSHTHTYTHTHTHTSPLLSLSVQPRHILSSVSSAGTLNLTTSIFNYVYF